MRRTWKNGDVALLQPGTSAERIGVRQQDGWGTSGGRMSDATDPAPDTHLPLVVLNPADAEQIKALAKAIKPCTSSALAVCGDYGCNDSRLSHALESLVAEPVPEVFAHVVLDAAHRTKTAVCGKVWEPVAEVVVVGKCPDCLSIVNDDPWVA